MRSKGRLAGESLAIGIGLICLMGAAQPVSAFDLSASPFLGSNPAGELDATALIPDCPAPKWLGDEFHTVGIKIEVFKNTIR